MADEQHDIRHQTTGRRPLHILTAVTAILGGACIGLSSYLIYDKVKSRMSINEIFKCPDNHHMFLEMFPTLKLSPEDAQKRLSAMASSDMTNRTSSVIGSGPILGCCESGSGMKIPSKLPTGEPGKIGNVTIYQKPYFQQAFVFKNCSTIPNCSANCRCELDHQQVLAVVLLDNKMCQLQFVLVPNCCLCLNN